MWQKLCITILSVSVLPALSLEQNAGTNYKDSFTEELLITPLFSEQLYAHFQFSTIWNPGPENERYHHSHLFPRAIGELVSRFNIQELHLSLTSGLWRYETWGYPVVDAAPGAEVWAWFKPDTKDVTQNWKLLANSLSGMLCASFNFVDTSNSVSPAFSFQPRGAVNWTHTNTSWVRYASLPREIVCTENLTPFKKLLPCGSRAGLASLLNSGYIHNTKYHSIQLHFRHICPAGHACDTPALELQLSVDLVYDYAILGTRDWSIKKLFGQGLNGKCPLSKLSNIYVDLSSRARHDFELTPEPNEIVTNLHRDKHYARYDIPRKYFSINSKHFGSLDLTVNVPPILSAHQYLTGYGQERGGIVTEISNNHWGPVEVVLLQNIAWYVPVYAHTLTINSNGQEIQPKTLKYRPGRQRQKPYYIELVVSLPPKSSTSISIDFDYVFLKWQEYPPDANHGFYIGSAVVSANLPLAKNYTGLPQRVSTIYGSFNSTESEYLVQVRTENMVLTLPTPDFSMPYNVICLACTVVALAFGPLHNITTKRLILKKKETETLLEKVRKKIVATFSKQKPKIDT